MFCEKGVFDKSSTIQILNAGKEVGLAGNFHCDELSSMGSGEIAAEVGARCVSHLEKVTAADVELMAWNQIVGVLLPTTAYILRLTPPPAREMIEKGENDILYLYFCLKLKKLHFFPCCYCKLQIVGCCYWIQNLMYIYCM